MLIKCQIQVVVLTLHDLEIIHLNKKYNRENCRMNAKIHGFYKGKKLQKKFCFFYRKSRTLNYIKDYSSRVFLGNQDSLQVIYLHLRLRF